MMRRAGGAVLNEPDPRVGDDFEFSDVEIDAMLDDPE
jgi:hypothetical protein